MKQMKNLKNIIFDIKAPLLATFFFTIANSYFNTKISVSLYKLGVNEFELGVVSNAFYIGVFLGSLFSVRYISKLGHSLSYQISLILYFASILLTILIENKFFWIVLRFMAGWGLASIWIIAESWILERSNNDIRGKMLSIYILSLNAANAIGQLFIGVPEYYNNLALLFVFGMIFISYLVIFLFRRDVSTIVTSNEDHDISLISFFLKSPISILVIIISGAFSSTLYSIIPYCFELMKFNHSYISILLFAMISGGSIFQYPIGYLADKVKKDIVLLLIFFVIVILSLLMVLLSPDSILYLLCFFLFGGVVFSIYPVSTNYICDIFKDTNLLILTKILILSYSFGNMIGPIVSPIYIYKLGASGVFYFFCSASSIVFIYLFIITIQKFKQKR